MAAKGPTIFNDDERVAIAKACKWVDEVVPKTPYTVTPGVLDDVNCSHVAHGDDMSIGADGKDTYHELR